LDLSWMLNPRSVCTDLGHFKKINNFNVQFEASWTFPIKIERPEMSNTIYKKTQFSPSLYVRYFRGFNQFLIDYNKETDWFGIGFYLR
jgi:outer membrane phospholipase A